MTALDYVGGFGMKPALHEAFKLGSYAGVVIGPLLAVGVLNLVNRSIKGPDDDVRWWPRANKYMLVTLVWMMGAAALVAGAFALGSLLNHHPTHLLKFRMCMGLWAGSGLGGLVAALWGLGR